MSKNNALVVLSGGQDSTTCLFWAKQHFDEVHAISFHYGQRHSRELQSACDVAQMAGVASYALMAIPPEMLKSASPLTSNNELAEFTSYDEMTAKAEGRVEQTFVPMRNTLFLTIAANHALANNCGTIVTGICQEDAGGYPDCTEMFRLKLESTLNQSLVGTERRIAIAAPLMYMSKAQTVELAARLPGCMEALAYSHTCYAGHFPPCGKCHSCVLRAHGFAEAGVMDPLVQRGVAHTEVQNAI